MRDDSHGISETAEPADGEVLARRIGPAARPNGEPGGRRVLPQCCKITNEHVILSWMTFGEDALRHLYVRESGGPDYEPHRHIRERPAGDLAAKGALRADNNGWMNDMVLATTARSMSLAHN